MSTSDEASQSHLVLFDQRVTSIRHLGHETVISATCFDGHNVFLIVTWHLVQHLAYATNAASLYELQP